MSLETIKITCKKCGSSGQVYKGSSNHKTKVCPNCEMKKLMGFDSVKLISVTVEKKKED